ncbi:RNA-binding motif protein 25 isoform X2 [Malania oleifera]|uniref:RNA-binding motif protein 25 isoform X2 n=1 Tax=Malania oleifera TaxID=397392 RepID=UPI0025AE5D63|nr:RNA-binding motif protein 25 isoform X2 [Malania oleifera]
MIVMFGIPRYPSPYAPMVRPGFPPRPLGAVGVLPTLPRPPIPGIRGPIIPAVVRPAVVPIITPAETPQTTVYVGKIAPTVENDFMLSLLRLCGPVKSWKRAQNPTDGTPLGFAFCEFESAEGVLRALRLLTKLNIDGQELVLNVNEATKEYLKRYVEKKTENSKKPKETEAEGDDKMEESGSAVEKNDPSKPSAEDSKMEVDDSRNKENNDSANFGIVTDEDKEADREALEKLTSMIEERLKTKPLSMPPTQGAVDGSGSSNLETNAKSRDGDSDVDIIRSDAAEDKNDDETTSETKPTTEQDKPEASSPDRSRRHDRSSRDRDRERDFKREKERELERYERERERERVRRERERELKIREAEQLYKERVKDWEIREREKDYQRQHEKEREKERQHQRRKEIRDQERDSDDDDDDSRKRRRRLEEKRRKRLREKGEDLADRLKEEEEIAEAKRRAEEEQRLQQQKDELKHVASQGMNGEEKDMPAEETVVETKDEAVEHAYNEGDSGLGNHIGDGILQNGNGEESTVASDIRQSSNAPARKLGFGLVGSGKRTAVPSVFHEEEDDDAHKEKKMRPLVPIDYSTEELQAVQPNNSGAAPPNLAAAAEFAKRISNVNPKDEKPDGERERSKRFHDRSRDRDRNDDDTNRARDENRERTLERDRDREHGVDKPKSSDNKNYLDKKQLIDMIPRTREELFSYEIDWSIYDKHGLHERMRPWISKKITEFLGEEETTLVDYIVTSTQNHVKASQMLELLQSILDDEAEMFVLKMWRMLIFEIKKVETGLSLRPKT